MTAVALSPITKVVTALAVPKTIAGYVSFDSGQRFRVEQPAAWIELEPVRDANGYELCFADDCGEALGSPWCCDQRASVVVAYRKQAAIVADRQRTPKEIVRESPVNAHPAGAR